MELRERVNLHILWLPAMGLPLALTALFYLLRGNRAAMDAWVTGVMGPAEQALGRFWSAVPFSVAEALIALTLAGTAAWLIRAAVLLVRERDRLALLRRLLALVALAAWLWCGLCWTWNAGYYAAGFSEKSGLEARAAIPQDLLETTLWFARNAARLSGEMARDEGGHFAERQEEYFARGVAVYDKLRREFPFLDVPPVRAKPLACSRLQSILGFTGIYFPFTGEANVNVDAPACLRPAAIAHEMAHQRMVASELEANFTGIAACVTCDDVVFQYSGYLMGLVELSNALYDVSPQAWRAVIEDTFTPELSTDWDDNYEYWSALESQVEETAAQTYDFYLKGNGQSLGMASYGACVDLLIAYFHG